MGPESGTPEVDRDSYTYGVGRAFGEFLTGPPRGPDPEIQRTVERINNNAPKYRQDGTVFQNREGRLPAQRDPNYYREWTVETPGASNRGARRLVTGQGGELYYTPDHYRTFINLIKK